MAGWDHEAKSSNRQEFDLDSNRLNLIVRVVQCSLGVAGTYVSAKLGYLFLVKQKYILLGQDFISFIKIKIIKLIGSMVALKLFHQISKLKWYNNSWTEVHTVLTGS